MFDPSVTLTGLFNFNSNESDHIYFLLIALKVKIENSASVYYRETSLLRNKGHHSSFNFSVK